MSSFKSQQISSTNQQNSQINSNNIESVNQKTIINPELSKSTRDSQENRQSNQTQNQSRLKEIDNKNLQVVPTGAEATQNYPIQSQIRAAIPMNQSVDSSNIKQQFQPAQSSPHGSQDQSQISPNPSKPHYKILLIGKSGAGKTTAINMFFNQAYSKQYEDERIIPITQKFDLNLPEGKIMNYILQNNLPQYKQSQSDTLKSSAESQTTKCFSYTIVQDSYEITFIDTPGLCDTDGTGQDKANLEQIKQAISSISDIDFVLYVHRATDIKKNSFLTKYVNTLRQEVLPDNLKKNFIVCFTGVFNPLRIEAAMMLEDIGISTEQKIAFENDCLLKQDIMKIDDSSMKEQYVEISQKFWKSNKRQYDKLISMVMQVQPTQKRQTQTAEMSLKKEEVIPQAPLEKQEKLKTNLNHQQTGSNKEGATNTQIGRQVNKGEQDQSEEQKQHSQDSNGGKKDSEEEKFLAENKQFKQQLLSEYLTQKNGSRLNNQQESQQQYSAQGQLQQQKDSEEANQINKKQEEFKQNQLQLQQEKEKELKQQEQQMKFQQQQQKQQQLQLQQQQQQQQQQQKQQQQQQQQQQQHQKQSNGQVQFEQNQQKEQSFQNLSQNQQKACKASALMKLIWQNVTQLGTLFQLNNVYFQTINSLQAAKLELNRLILQNKPLYKLQKHIVRENIKEKNLRILSDPVIFCYACLEICEQSCQSKEPQILIGNAIPKECKQCPHLPAFHITSKEILKTELKIYERDHYSLKENIQIQGSGMICNRQLLGIEFSNATSLAQIYEKEKEKINQKLTIQTNSIAYFLKITEGAEIDGFNKETLIGYIKNWNQLWSKDLLGGADIQQLINRELISSNKNMNISKHMEEYLDSILQETIRNTAKEKYGCHSNELVDFD